MRAKLAEAETLPRRRLAAELAVAVSQFVRETLLHDTDEHGYVFHSFQGPFDEDCYTVWELGAAWATRESRGERLTFEAWEAQGPPLGDAPYLFKFMPSEQIRRVVMEREDIAPQLLLRLMMAYLRSMGEYGWRGAFLTLDRAPFVPDPIFLPQIEALIDCGYLRRRGARVEWTGQAAPAMPAESAGTPSFISSTAPATVLLKLKGPLADVRTIEATSALHRRGVSLLDAKRAVEAATEQRADAFVACAVDDLEALGDALDPCGFKLSRVKPALPS